MILCAFYIR
ncbi:hypothetical protein R3I93_019508 [Phoxinus phoxinus]|uniref:Uncharacterized protein n=1 Tax=Phoxinus phoxinus TaxID=58324 RepID=A0AAN9CD10_9TELE